MPTTKSSFLTLMPMTPLACLPITRTSSSLNRIPCPLEVPRIIVSPPELNAQKTNSSPSFKVTARIPVLRIFANPFAAVRLIIPLRVTITTNCSSISRTGNNFTTCSPSCSSNKLTIARPRAIRDASGTSNVCKLYIRPKLVKNSKVSCVFATNIS